MSVVSAHIMSAGKGSARIGLATVICSLLLRCRYFLEVALVVKLLVNHTARCESNSSTLLYSRLVQYDYSIPFF